MHSKYNNVDKGNLYKVKDIHSRYLENSYIA